MKERETDSGVWRVLCAPDRRGGGPYWCGACKRDLFPEAVLVDGAVAGYVYTHDAIPHPEWEHEEAAMTTLREALAAYAHDTWVGWMTYLFEQSREGSDGSVTIPADLVTRWRRQMTTAYKDLSKSEQDSDRIEADVMIDIFSAGGVRAPTGK